MKRQLALCTALIVAPAMLQAAVYTLYDGATGNIATDTAAWNAASDFGDGTTYSVENAAPVTPFNDGNAMRMYDLSTADKPELQGELGSALTGAYRVDFQSYNDSTGYWAETDAIRFRMANSGKSVTSESRSAFSLSWQADGAITAKFSDSGLDDSDATDVDTKSYKGANNVANENLFKVIDVTIVGNNSTVANYGYSLFGETRSLNPQSYDVYIDDGNGFFLLNNDADAWEANGLKYTLEKSAGEYDPALGIQRFGLLGSSNSDLGPNVLYDNILLKTGDDIIPEPATFGLLAVSGGLLLGFRRLRK